ncbi:hypothetical protein KC19_VG207500 [Ceratodon purpureus]|uniref:Ferredoxin-thioredoxin reductase catalytic chain, chloroplastic n=1 Tax=Ceratodon purpureus TaxID=3225 RepID=A0A8T0HSL5_CERPU|nr:hypothetical protein KC19_VG207500 [Ceratodon purpureus]
MACLMACLMASLGLLLLVLLFQGVPESGQQGLAEHKDTLGAPLCPCRFVTTGLRVFNRTFRINFLFFAQLH